MGGQCLKKLPVNGFKWVKQKNCRKLIKTS